MLTLDDMKALTQPYNDKLVELAQMRAERDQLKAQLRKIREIIPMDFLRASDAPGATSPTNDLDLVAAIRLMVRHGRMLERPHVHVAGTTVGKHIDECAECGRDLRDPIHSTQVR